VKSKSTNGKLTILLALAASFISMAAAQPLRAQDSDGAVTASGLWVNKKTGQVFITPGRNRVRLKIKSALDADAISQQVEQQVQQKTAEQVRAAVAESRAQQQADTAALQKQVAQIQPVWKNYVDNFQNKFRIGALAYLDYSAYTHTGFGPQTLENVNPPGPGNNGFNSFDISRVYTNIYYTPTDDLLFRFTPEVYRANGTATASSVSSTSATASNLTGNLNVRLKYAYIQYTGLLDGLQPLKDGNLTLGAQPNPFIPWQEDMYQYRFVNLGPWNYVGLSSSQIGLQANGPVKLYGGEATYLEYGAGVYDAGTFRSQTQSAWPQMMGRLTAYPFGADWRYQGLGLTGFYNYGWGNASPDQQGISTPLKSTTSYFERLAALVHYNAEQWNIAGEFDYGKNAFTLSNLYSGSGPLDAFGTATGTAVTHGFAGNPTCTAAAPCYNGFGTFGPQVAVYQAELNNGRARQLGLDFFGHYHIPGTKLTAFGMFQWFMPNDAIQENPLDFQRFIAGVSYQYNPYLRFALDSQNLLFYHSQFGIPVADAATFNYVPGEVLNGRKLPSVGSFVIPNLVPRDQHAIFLNAEFAY
jgi:hypothetical protein